MSVGDFQRCTAQEGTTESISDVSKVQYLGDLASQKILMSSAKRIYLDYLITLRIPWAALTSSAIPTTTTTK